MNGLINIKNIHCIVLHIVNVLIVVEEQVILNKHLLKNFKIDSKIKCNIINFYYLKFYFY